MPGNHAADKTGRRSIRRLLVALDGSHPSLAALQAGVELAARLNAEISGLFVEDQQLLDMAALPGCREIMRLPPFSRPLDAIELRRHFRLQAKRMRRVLERSCQRAGVEGRFRIASGKVPEAIAEAAENSDLVILGKSGYSLLGGARVGSTVRYLLGRQSGVSMIVSQRQSLETPVMLFYAGDSASEKALTVAADLTRDKESYLVVFLPPASEAKRERWKASLDESWKTTGIRYQVVSLPQASPDAISYTVRLHSRGPLVLSCDGQRFPKAVVEGVLQDIPNPLLLVRGK